MFICREKMGLFNMLPKINIKIFINCFFALQLFEFAVKENWLI